jgi:hypothetical protein
MKMIRVNITDRTVSDETVPSDYTGWGGRGLAAAVIQREVPAGCPSAPRAH